MPFASTTLPEAPGTLKLRVTLVADVEGTIESMPAARAAQLQRTIGRRVSIFFFILSDWILGFRVYLMRD
jgi:hypothetical protein